MSNSFKIEWLFINLRWFLLVAVASVIGVNVILTENAFPRSVLILLIVGSVANLTAMVALLQNAGDKAIRNMMLILDILLTLGFVASSPDLGSQLLFVSLIPILTMALRVSWLSSILITFLIVLTYWIIAWYIGGLSTEMPIGNIIGAFVHHITNGGILIIAGIAISGTTVRIKQTLMDERDKQERESQHALNMAHQRASLIFELASTLSATLNYEHVLEAALDVSHAGLQEFFTDPMDVSQVGMILLFGMDESLYIAKSRGLSGREEQTRFLAHDGVLAQALSGTDTVVSNTPGDDPELEKIAKFRDCHQAIVVPLRAGYESYGLLVLGSPEPDIYTADFQDLLTAICNQAVLALQNASLYQNLMDEKDRLVTVEEDARKKLARDLHDGPTQTIAAIAMRLNYIRLLLKQDPDEAVKELKQLEELARTTTKEIRQMLFTLRPLILESQGVIAAIRQLKQKINETDDTPIHLEADPDVERLLSKDAKGSIFYIVEEATTNARKHAKANNIWIRLYQRGMSAVAEIEDDGAGFDVAALESDYASRGSLGMINLRERATLVKGKTVINSAPGEGTKIVVTVPLETPPPEVNEEEEDTEEAQA